MVCYCGIVNICPSGKRRPRRNRMTTRGWCAVALCCFGLFSASTPAAAAERAAMLLKTMGNGVNILGYDGIWDGHRDAPFQLGDLRRIREAGFRHVRINLFGFERMDSERRLNPQTLAALDNVVEQAILSGLIPVIDEHDADACQQAPSSCAEKLRAFWSQIAPRYANRYRYIVYEILNEPGGNMDRGQWNALALEILNLIRKADPDRVVIVAALNSDDPQSLQTIDLPEGDRNIILTAHYYKPFAFTHQGAPWAGLKDSHE